MARMSSLMVALPTSSSNDQKGVDMASFTGITAAKADAILGQSVVSGYINPSGHLILTRSDGSTIDAGDFTGIVTGIHRAPSGVAVC